MSSGLPLIPQFVERFIQSWADKRQPCFQHEITINRRQLYILPTRHGIIYFLILLLILFGSINYQNSLGFMLTFLLGSLGLLGMIYTHQNINQLSIKISRAEPVFYGQDILFPLQLSHSSTNPMVNIQLQSISGQCVSVNLINTNSTHCKLILSAPHRGYISSGKIKLFTEYPLGLFHAWSWLKLESHCLVYPEPDTHHHPLIFTDENGSGLSHCDKQGVDDFTGIRQYHKGDQPNHMAWKAIAKTGILQTKLYNSETDRKIIIKWKQTDETLDIERRLSILCRMVIDADSQNISYGLHLPGTSISPSSGLRHKQVCLKALALFGHTQ